MKKRYFLLLLIAFLAFPAFADDDDDDDDEDDIYWERPLKNSVSIDLVPTIHSMVMGGLGVGINYERYFTKHLGLRLDVDYLQASNFYYSNDYYYDDYGYYEETTVEHYLNVTTGLRLYPFGEEHRWLFFGINGGIQYMLSVDENYSTTYQQVIQAVFTFDMGMRFTMAKNHCFSLEPVVQLQYYPRQLRKVLDGSGSYVIPYIPVITVPDLYLDIGFRIGFSF